MTDKHTPPPNWGGREGAEQRQPDQGPQQRHHEHHIQPPQPSGQDRV